MSTTLSINGTPSAVVPAEPLPEIVAAWWRTKNGHHFADEPPPTDTSDYAAYRAVLSAADPSLLGAVVQLVRAAQGVAAWKDAIQIVAPELGGTLTAIYHLEAVLARISIQETTDGG